MRRNYKEEEEFDVDEVKSSDEEMEEGKEESIFECPLCGAEVEDEGYCDDCRENQEIDDDF
ncbi:MAG: hypothetical protein WC471_01140 [Candidatus Woesearchaeota archaeon]